MTAEPFVGPEEVRAHLAFEAIETVYRLCRRGLPHRRIGRHLRFKLSEVDAWVEREGATRQGAEVVELASRRAG